MTPEQINKRFAELAGVPWHEKASIKPDISPNGAVWVTLVVCSCGDEVFDCQWADHRKNPDFCADPRLVLEVMMKRRDWKDFVWVVGIYKEQTNKIYICYDYIRDTTGLLALAAIEWMEMTKTVPVFSNPVLSEWKCYLFGASNNTMGMVYRPLEGNEPNFFWRWMQYICFGNRWVKEGKK